MTQEPTSSEEFTSMVDMAYAALHAMTQRAAQTSEGTTPPDLILVVDEGMAPVRVAGDISQAELKEVFNEILRQGRENGIDLDLKTMFKPQRATAGMVLADGKGSSLERPTLKGPQTRAIRATGRRLGLLSGIAVGAVWAAGDFLLAKLLLNPLVDDNVLSGPDQILIGSLAGIVLAAPYVILIQPVIADAVSRSYVRRRTDPKHRDPAGPAT